MHGTIGQTFVFIRLSVTGWTGGKLLRKHTNRQLHSKGNKIKAIVLILSDVRGTYIPRDFLTDGLGNIAEDHCAAWGLTTDNSDWWEDAVNPCSEHYWDCWDWIINNAKYTTPDGDIYRLYQDGDLWGICYEKMTEEEKENFGFD